MLIDPVFTPCIRLWAVLWSFLQGWGGPPCISLSHWWSFLLPRPAISPASNLCGSLGWSWAGHRWDLRFSCLPFPLALGLQWSRRGNFPIGWSWQSMSRKFDPTFCPLLSPLSPHSLSVRTSDAYGDDCLISLGYSSTGRVSHALLLVSHTPVTSWSNQLCWSGNILASNGSPYCNTAYSTK